MSTQTTPETHLTRQAEGWTLIHQGQPLTADGRTLADCMAVAARAKLHISEHVWSAAKGTWQSLAEAKNQPQQRGTCPECRATFTWGRGQTATENPYCDDCQNRLSETSSERHTQHLSDFIDAE